MLDRDCLLPRPRRDDSAHLSSLSLPLSFLSFHTKCTTTRPSRARPSRSRSSRYVTERESTVAKQKSEESDDDDDDGRRRRLPMKKTFFSHLTSFRFSLLSTLIHKLTVRHDRERQVQDPGQRGYVLVGSAAEESGKIDACFRRPGLSPSIESGRRHSPRSIARVGVGIERAALASPGSPWIHILSGQERAPRSPSSIHAQF